MNDIPASGQTSFSLDVTQRRRPDYDPEACEIAGKAYAEAVLLVRPKKVLRKLEREWRYQANMQPYRKTMPADPKAAAKWPGYTLAAEPMQQRDVKVTSKYTRQMFETMLAGYENQEKQVKANDALARLAERLKK